MAIGGILAPGLLEVAEVDFDFRPCGAQEGANHRSLRKVHHRVNAGKSLGPGAAKKPGQHGFSLVVAGVGGGDSIHRSGCHEASKPGVAEAPGGLFDGLGGLAGGRPGEGFGGRIDARLVERKMQTLCQITAEGKVGIRLGATQAVVQVSRVENHAQFFA